MKDNPARPHVTIHRLTKEFIPKILKFPLDYPEIFSDADIKKYKEEFGKDFKFSALIVSDGEDAYGLISFNRDQESHNFYKIGLLIVRKGFENMGYGSLLMFAALKRIREEGGRHVYLMTSGERHNAKAKHFYEKIGFQEAGVLKDFYDHPKKGFSKLENAIIFEKDL